MTCVMNFTKKCNIGMRWFKSSKRLCQNIFDGKCKNCGYTAYLMFKPGIRFCGLWFIVLVIMDLTKYNLLIPTSFVWFAVWTLIFKSNLSCHNFSVQLKILDVFWILQKGCLFAFSGLCISFECLDWKLAQLWPFRSSSSFSSISKLSL